MSLPPGPAPSLPPYAAPAAPVPTRRRLRRALAAVGLTVAAPATASGPFSAFGHDADNLGVASSGVAHGRSAGLAHTNPAALAGVAPHVEVMVTFLGPRLHIELMPRPPGSEVPISVYDSTVGTDPRLDSRPLPTRELPLPRRSLQLTDPEGWLGLGLVTELGLPQLRVGGVLIVPVTQGTAASVTTHYSDEREAPFSNQVHFSRFGEWTRLTALVAGAAYRATPWLDVGLGTQLGVAAVARLGVYIPNAAVQDRSYSNLSTEIATRWRPVLGVRFRPHPALDLGLCFRGESAFELEGENQVRLWNHHQPGGDRAVPEVTTQRFPTVVGFEPREIALGVAARLAGVQAQLGLTHQAWSSFRDHHGERPEHAALATPQIAGRFAFRDVWEVSTGLRVPYHARAELLAGATYQPSPVPPQVGRTSHGDSDVAGFTVGQRVRVELLGRHVDLLASGGLFTLARRTVHKDPALVPDEFPDDARTLRGNQPMPEARGLQTNAPGYPGYTVGGHVLVGTFAMSFPY